MKHSLTRESRDSTAKDRNESLQFLNQNADALHAHVVHAFEAASGGRALPKMEVRFEHLSLSAELVVAHQDPQISAQELPTVTNTVRKAFRHLRAAKHSVTKHILRDVSGVFKPGTMTLILAQPGSGKSALMKALAGRFPMTKNITLDGNIAYNGKAPREIGNRLAQIVGYVPQLDKHYPTLTIKETLEFAHETCGGGMPYNADVLFANGTTEAKQAAIEAGRALEEHYTDIMIKQFGLEKCQNTIVGNAMVRGISGGERKRLTTSEMLFGDKNVLLLDEISTGLDSAATYDIVKMYQSLAKHYHKTVVMALLQPAPEVFELFDEVMMLNKGYVVYHGPCNGVLKYFEGLGFQCPPQRDTADFLMDLGTHQQHQYEVDRADGKLQPRKASEFAQYFELSPLHVSTLQDLASPVDSSLVEDNTRYFDHMPAFRQSFLANTRVATMRQLRVAMRNRAFLRGRAMMVLIMGFMNAVVFSGVNLKNSQIVMGLLFSANLFLALGQATQIPTLIAARDTFYKQRGANFLRTASYAFACSVAQMPLALLETLVFGSIVYFSCGFVKSVGSFLFFEVMILGTIICFGAFFFFLAAVIPNLHIAKPISMVSNLFFNLFAGFIISRGEIPPYFIWIYYIDPFAWSIRALAVSQYRQKRFDVEVYDGINYMTLYGKRMSEYSLSLYNVQTEKYWMWLGLVYVLVAYFGFMMLACLVLEHFRYETPENISLDSEASDDIRNEMISSSSDNSSVSYALVATPTSAQTSASAHTDEVAVEVLSAEWSPRFVPVTLAFKDLWYTVMDPKNPKQTIDLLKGIDGYAMPGKITALMGSTGAGKTTLMDVIAGRKTEGKIRGQILLNGHPATPLAIQRSTGYCEQMDIHSEGSTIREALTFSAFLRQSSDVPDDVKRESVEECLDLLDLRPIADQIVRGSSVEQMKRLTIGVEVAAQPSVLFLDEPTSGLDARSAKIIMDGVRKVADTGRTIVCTIHQPSWKVFQVFDSLLLLKLGGQTVFFGDLGPKAKNLVKYFSSISGTARIEKGANPATWMLEVIGAGVGNTNGQNTDFVSIFNESTNAQQMNQVLDQEGVGHPSTEIAPVSFRKKRAASNWTQMKLLTQRFLDLYWRTPSYSLTRFVVFLFLGIVFGLAFMHVKFTTFQGINAKEGMINMTTIFLGIVVYNSVLPLASDDRAPFYRERASQTYNALWYFFGSTVAEIPFVVVSALLFLAIFFPMVGFSGVERFLLYWAGLSLHLLVQTYLGMLFAYALPSIEVAAIIGVLVNSVLFLFMGFNPPASAIPSALRWMRIISPPRYSLEILSAIVLADCPDPSSSYLACQRITNLPPTLPSNLTVKQYVEKVFQMKHEDIGSNFIILFGIMVLLRLLGLMSLRWINHQKR